MKAVRWTLAFGLTAIACNSFTKAAEESASSLVSQLISSYKAVETVRLEAVGDASIYDVVIDGQTKPGIRNVHSQLSYVAKGKCYLIDSKWDPKTAPDMDYKFVFNGSRYEQLDRETSSMTVMNHDSVQLAIVSEIPLFFPVQFLNRSQDGHLSCAIKLMALQDKSSLEKAPPMCRWLDKTAMVVEMPGRIRYSHPTTWQIYFGASPERYLPKQIRDVDDQGRIIECLTFEGYKSVVIANGQNVFYPDTVLRDRRDAANNPYIEEVIHVKSCIFNQPVDDSEFTIDFDEAQSIWDKDAQTFIVERGGIQPPQKISGITPTSNSGPPEPALAATGSIDEARKKHLWFWLSLMGVALISSAVSVLYLYRLLVDAPLQRLTEAPYSLESLAT